MNEILFWIIGSTVAMSLLSLIGVITLILSEKLLKKIILPLVAFSAGSLLAGAMLHMIPESIEGGLDTDVVFYLVIAGFLSFLFLENFINWHHCHRTPGNHKHPVGYLILIADGIHNFLGGIAIGGAFLVDINLGIITWFIALLHEIPQELGDFGILLHSGWSKKAALIYNLLSGSSMVLGGLLIYLLSDPINSLYILPFAGGNFIYIATSDLIPEIKHNCGQKSILHFLALIAGILLLASIKLLF